MQNEWQSFLQQQSANLIDGLVTDFGNPQAERLHANAENIIADLPRQYGKPEEWIRTLGKRVVKLDVKDWGIEAGWAKIGEGDVNWAKVCASLDEIGFTGWATAEVGGGDRKVLADIKQRMDKVLSM